MTEIRRDPFSDAIVIYSPERAERPDYTGYEKKIVLKPENCPFCEGNEEMTPPEIISVRAKGNKNGPGWKVRVIPNKFPVLGIEGETSVGGAGCYESISAVGAHEVIIETPDHELQKKELNPYHYERIFGIIRERIADLKNDERFKYIQVFKNHGSPAGATISHHHSQLIALPFIPGSIKTMLDKAKLFYEKTGRSIFDEILKTEKESGTRVILENTSFVAFSPYYSPSPFFVSIFQKNGGARFEEANEKKLKDLSDIYFKLMQKIEAALGNISFNLILNNSPFDINSGSFYSWTIDLAPVISGTGGFEAATGNFINSFLPERSAEILRKY
ncbi:MAG: DUF4931 domain-containing protein [Acidobacteriota bacterium]